VVSGASFVVIGAGEKSSDFDMRDETLKESESLNLLVTEGCPVAPYWLIDRNFGVSGRASVSGNLLLSVFSRELLSSWLSTSNTFVPDNSAVSIRSFVLENPEEGLGGAVFDKSRVGEK
jgi:hypothetical protein